MANMTLLVAIFGIGLIGNIIVRKVRSRALRLLIGMPMMILMGVLAFMWWQA